MKCEFKSKVRLKIRITRYQNCMISFNLHRCKIPGYDNDTYQIQNEHHEEILQRYIPVDESQDGGYDQCHVYRMEQSFGKTRNDSRPTEKCSVWVYDTSLFDETFVTKVFICL